MSREHTTVTVTVKCKNLTCGHTHTAFILLYGGQKQKIKCPVCGWHTYQKDLDIIQTHGTVKF